MNFKILIYISFLGFISCIEPQPDKEIISQSNPPPPPDMLISSNLNLLIPNNKLNIILDSIIHAEKKCKLFNHINSAFRVLSIKSEDGYKLTISSVNISNYDFSKSLGYFKYNSLTFIYEGILIPSLISYSGVEEIIRYSKPLPNTFEIDDRFSDWYLVFKNDSLELSGHHKCY